METGAGGEPAGDSGLEGEVPAPRREAAPPLEQGSRRGEPLQQQASEISPRPDWSAPSAPPRDMAVSEVRFKLLPPGPVPAGTAPAPGGEMAGEAQVHRAVEPGAMKTRRPGATIEVGAAPAPVEIAMPPVPLLPAVASAPGGLQGQDGAHPRERGRDWQAEDGNRELAGTAPAVSMRVEELEFQGHGADQPFVSGIFPEQARFLVPRPQPAWEPPAPEPPVPGGVSAAPEAEATRIEVRIGRVEIQAAGQLAPTPAAGSRGDRGFAEYALARRYRDRVWY